MNLKKLGAFSLLGGVSLAALSIASSASAASETSTAAAENFANRLDMRGAYLSGDKHNHTTCSDGSTSVRTLVDQSTVIYGLDWFAQTGHGGSFNRDCRFNDPEYDASASGDGYLWTETVGQDALKGDENGDKMWRWQSISEFAYQDVANAGRISGKATWIGLETNAPGHEHVSMGILGDQFRTRGDAYATAQFEYLWDRNDNDFSGGDDYDFENAGNDGVAKAANIAGDHSKAVASVAWIRDNHRKDGYYVISHVERQGAYTTGENRGYNVEDLRDFHNAGLFNPNDVTGESVAFGGEFAPGHQFSGDRGSYSLSRPTAGFGTYGGAGAYVAAEIAAPGKNWDGSDLTDADLETISDEIDAATGGVGPRFNTTRPKMRYVLGKPGVKTMWDAMLGEGRRYFMFFSSDWHSRGGFSPWEKQSTQDPWPGEYQKIWAYTRGGDKGYSYSTARQVVNGMRKGNAFSVMGDLVHDFRFIMCQGSACATMGETLTVDPAGEPVVWYVSLTDPEGVNNAPYTFANPSLAQIGVSIPLNQPELNNIDIIRGDVTGPIDPADPAYKSNVSNPSTEIFTSVFNPAYAAPGATAFTVDGEKMTVSGEIPAASFTNEMYFRIRGTNMAKGTPNETDADGNPLLDNFANNIVCSIPYADPDPATEAQEFNPKTCPTHLPVNERLAGAPQVVSNDVEAWADLWFYANPIFVEIKGAEGRRAETGANDSRG
ncbi:MAG: hypothetical protein ACK5MQ_08920 [Pikeienuella sp.]